MNRNEIIIEIKKYFRIEELVCEHTFNKFGQNSWQFLSTEILHSLLIVRRDILKVGMVINDYAFGGKNTQRGLRCNICPLVKEKTALNKIYLSAHNTGNGFDAVSGKITASEMRKKIDEKAGLLPYPIRLENDATWLHLDTYDYLNGDKINYFNG